MVTPHGFRAIRIYSVGVWNSFFHNSLFVNGGLEFAPLEFETSKFKPIDYKYLIRIYSVGVWNPVIVYSITLGSFD